MHTSDQSPQSSDKETQEQAPQQPLYEFPADYPSQPAHSEEVQPVANAGQGVSAEPAASELHPPSDQAILQGLVYPPPPSFYMKTKEAQSSQDTQVPPAQPAFPGVPPTPISNWQGYSSGLQPPLFAPGAQPAVKRSRKWIWIVVAVLSVGLLGGCGLCGWAFYNVFGNAISQATTVNTLVTNYYDAIKAHDYARAYSYISPQDMIGDMTEQKFTQQAQSMDNQFGPVLDFTPQSSGITAVPSSDPTQVNSFSYTVQVSRAKKTYNVLLTLRRINGQWKITDFDRI